MFRARKQARRLRKMPRWMTVSLIVLLSTGAIALSYVAFTDIGSGEHPGLPVKPEPPISEDIVSSTPFLPTDTQPEPAVNPTGRSAPQRMLAMVGGIAMRSTSGTCGSPGTVEVSTDSAQSWNLSDSLAGAGATQILRLLPTNPSLIQLVALDSSCEPQVYRSADLGTSWEGPLPVLGIWYFDSTNPMQVGTPNGPQPLRCEGAELAAAGDRAAVRCLDGSIVTTVDRGITWSESPRVADTLAINYSPDSYVVAQTGNQTCEGLRLTTLGSGPSTSPDGCFDGVLIADGSNPENIAVAQSGTSTLLWVGNKLVTSTDGGRTWL